MNEWLLASIANIDAPWNRAIVVRRRGLKRAFCYGRCLDNISAYSNVSSLLPSVQSLHCVLLMGNMQTFCSENTRKLNNSYSNALNCSWFEESIHVLSRYFHYLPVFVKHFNAKHPSTDYHPQNNGFNSINPNSLYFALQADYLIVINQKNFADY